MDRALAVYSRYVEQFPKPVEAAVETRFKMAEIFKAHGDTRNTTSSSSRSFASMPRRAASERTAPGMSRRARRWRWPGPLYERFAAVKLLQPFERSLREKRQEMDAAISAFSDLVSYEVGEVTAAATFYMAEIYSNFSRSLVESERPGGLAVGTCRSTRTRSRRRRSRSRRRRLPSTRRTSS